MTQLADARGKPLGLNDFVHIVKLPEHYLAKEDPFYGDMQATMGKVNGGVGRIRRFDEIEQWHDGGNVYVWARVLDDQAVKDVPVLVPSSNLVVLEWNRDLMAFFVDVELNSVEIADDGFAIPVGSLRYQLLNQVHDRIVAGLA